MEADSASVEKLKQLAMAKAGGIEYLQGLGLPGKSLTNAEARAAWKVLIALPDQVIKEYDTGRPDVEKPGIFQNEHGIIVVKYNRQGTRLYAQLLKNINVQRRMADGSAAKIEYEYKKGLIYSVQERHRLSPERARALTVLYGRCLFCNRPLKAKKSVDQMAGDHCMKLYGGGS